MAITDADMKLLWGRAAGICSKPGCNTDLTRLVEGGGGYTIGEMAHVISPKPKGPRGGDGTDAYGNLILLCPTHHREIDKAPAGMFPEETLLDWKRRHEEQVRRLGLEQRYSSAEELARTVRAVLAENFEVWKTLGPKSELARSNPGSNAHKLWELRRADKLVPNNRRIMNIIRANEDLLTEQQRSAFAEFIVHAESFEEHVHQRLDSYPLFPQSFSKAFE